MFLICNEIWVISMHSLCWDRKKSRTFKIKSHLPSQTIEDPTCLYHSYNIAFPDQPTTECDFNGPVVPVFITDVYQNITNS